MKGDRVLFDANFGSDFLIGFTRRDFAQNLDLPL